jgi:hypothetical protein
MFGAFKLIAGDFPLNKEAQFVFGQFVLPIPGKWLKTETIGTDRIVEVEQVSADTARKVGRTVGWGVAGALVAGPLGAVAAGIIGGKKSDVTFIVRFDDGRKFMGLMKPDQFKKNGDAIDDGRKSETAWQYGSIWRGFLKRLIEIATRCKIMSTGPIAIRSPAPEAKAG